MNDKQRNKKRASDFTLIVSFVCIALVGLALIPLLPIKLNPSRTLPGFSVDFTMPGTSARVVEMEVTSKLESMLSRIKGIKNINSNSGNGWGNISVELDKYAKTDIVRFEASTIIRETWPELPDGVSYPIISMKLSDDDAARPFLTYTLNAPSDPILIQRYAEEHIKTRLAQIPGVYKIDVSGATPMEWRLEYDSRQLQSLDITTGDIYNAVQQSCNKEFLGIYNIKTSQGNEWIRLVLNPDSGNRQDVFDASKIVVNNHKGRLIHLDELVKVTHEEEEPQNYVRINGLNSIYLSITAEGTANQLQLSKKIKDELETIKLNLPTGYKIHISYDATEYIQQELNKIYFRTCLTVVILLLFVLLITRRFKYLLLIVISLTVNIAIAVIFYYLLHLEIQLYSLAGITVSLNLIIDNMIVVTDHYLRRRNLCIFVSILAATLTTMGALVIIFFLDEKIRLNLQDFAAVVMINLAVSLFVSLFFVPSLIDKIGLKWRKWKAVGHWHWQNSKGMVRIRAFNHRFPVYFTHFYIRLIRILCRWRVAVCMLLLLLFGIPVFLLPDSIDKNNCWADIYNHTLGADKYKNDIKPVVDKVLGGSLRLFIQKVYVGSYFSRNDEVVLNIDASLPNGSTLEQMNILIQKMEIFLSSYKGIKQFQTFVESANHASINIFFSKENQYNGFPYTLKADIINEALKLGGGSWSVFGLEDEGFSNDVRENAGSSHIKMYGYNYDELYHWAEILKDILLKHRRIKEVLINSDFSWYKDDYQEYYMNLYKARMAQQKVTASALFSVASPLFGRDMNIGEVHASDGEENIKLSSRQSEDYDVWALQHFPNIVGDSLSFKFSELAKVDKEQAPQQVAKENQQYRLCLQYEYIGSSERGNKLLEKDLKAFNKMLPVGYSATSDSEQWSWNEKDTKQYRLLLVVIVIIFFITAILFNSLKQPLAIIFVIPVSYIGVFLTFYWFKLNFDQGGFAAFVLLCGITVNASIYILNEYNDVRRRFPNLKPLLAYAKAWNTRIIPIFLTIVSTILGFIPFMIGKEKEAFWFPLAAGTIGGLVMSFIGVFIFLPILTLKRNEIAKKP
jgi:multidrug efflux pump subunit AcrB